MKANLSISMVVLSVALVVNSATAQQKVADKDEKRQQVREMLQDSTMRSMVMESIARDPEMRRQAMQQMRTSPGMAARGKMKPSMRGGYMTQDSVMQAHMQEHRLLMKLMREEHAKMGWKMPDSPEARRKMMEWHIKCMESIQDPAMRNRNPQEY